MTQPATSYATLVARLWRRSCGQPVRSLLRSQLKRHSILKSEATQLWRNSCGQTLEPPCVAKLRVRLFVIKMFTATDVTTRGHLYGQTLEPRLRPNTEAMLVVKTLRPLSRPATTATHVVEPIGHSCGQAHRRYLFTHTSSSEDYGAQA